MKEGKNPERKEGKGRNAPLLIHGVCSIVCTTFYGDVLCMHVQYVCSSENDNNMQHATIIRNGPSSFVVAAAMVEKATSSFLAILNLIPKLYQDKREREKEPTRFLVAQPIP